MDRLEYLRNRYFENTATPAEREELYQVIKNIDPDQSGFFRSLENDLAGESEVTAAERRKLDQIFARIEENIHSKRGSRRTVRMFETRTVLRIAATLLILVAAGFGIYRLASTPDTTVESITKTDFVAGTDKAILQLADGTDVALEGNTSIPKQGNADVHNNDGKLAYIPDAPPTGTIFNKIITPRGGKYQLTLADGSNVWLNAASSLKFPTSFNGNERVVELDGEAYFEIAHNESMPFKVRMNSGAEVQVLGTHFNVMSYDDEESIKTTLIEGSVQVDVPGEGGRISSVRIRPDQQAAISKDGRLSVSDVNASYAIAWKDNKFNFRNMSLPEIIRQVERWYDVDVTYEEDISDLHFIGVVSRKENASAVLRVLEATGSVKFEVSNNKIILKRTKKK